MTKPVRFTEADLARAVRAMRKAGELVAGAKVETDGSIVVLTGTAQPANDANPLDRVLHK
jgi:hypothetical protein